MRKLTMLLLLVTFGIFNFLVAQENSQDWKWKKHVKQAEEYYAQSQYANAAYHFNEAYSKKPKKLQYAFDAGKNYLIIKDYRRAEALFEQVSKQFKKFPKAQYYYAKALKHNEKYQEAIREFKAFADRYTGENASEMVSEALQEMEASYNASEYKNNTNPRIRITHLDNAVNTKQVDFSPVPYGNDELLFSSTQQDYAKIFTTKRGMREWESPDVPAQFANLEGSHVCNPAFTPDEKRMYFTICKSVENWGALTTRCEIYVTKRVGNLWSAPERLPDKINQAEVTSTQPNVVHMDGKEILYFASNRAGGQGGMDIWYATRKLDGGDLAFTAPKNAGAKINTERNEITPYYNIGERMLYFSSDGHMTMGGLDIFSVEGTQSEWQFPVNVGSPYNSGADDYFYIQNRYGDGGFFVSNRTFQHKKETTTDEDIFEFKRNQAKQEYVIKGIIYDQEDSIPLSNVEVSIFEILGDQRERIVQSSVFETGSYLLRVPSDKSYKLVAHKDGYQPDTRTFTTGVSGTQTEYLYLQNLSGSSTPPPPSFPITKPGDILTPMPTTLDNTETIVEKEKMQVEPTEKIITPPIKEPTRPAIHNTNESLEYVYTPSSPLEAFQLRTKAPRHTGVYYKIQIIALADFSFDDSRFSSIKDWMRLDYELIVDKGITRALLADFFTKAEAEKMLMKAKNNGFPTAFIVKYEDGERVERVR